MSETIDSRSGIKRSFARSQLLLTVERKSPSFLGERTEAFLGKWASLPFSQFNPGAQSGASSYRELLDSPVGEFFPETEGRAWALGLPGPKDCRSSSSCPDRSTQTGSLPCVNWLGPERGSVRTQEARLPCGSPAGCESPRPSTACAPHQPAEISRSRWAGGVTTRKQDYRDASTQEAGRFGEKWRLRKHSQGRKAEEP